MFYWCKRCSRFDVKRMNPITISGMNGPSSEIDNLMILYYLIYGLDKKKCSLTLYSTSSPAKMPLDWTIEAKELYNQYNIKAYNKSHATIKKKQPKFALSNYQAYFISLQALKDCLQPPNSLSTNSTNGIY